MMKITPLLATVMLVVVGALAPRLCADTKGQAIDLDVFFEHVDTGANLPANKIYPQGRIFPYMGYSGKNAQDATNGFSVGGHHYGKLSMQREKLANAKAAGLSYVYGVGLDGSFHTDPPLQFTEESLRAEIQRQVLAVANDPGVAWWYVRPEELRMWRKHEKEYLRIVTEAIRATDPQSRPIWMYDPNHRTSQGLTATGQYLDIVGKGCYVNLAGYQDDRVWVRWTMEQETEACADLQKLDGRMRTPIIMPQLSKDPQDLALDGMIPTWVRHDVYLGLMTGARGVAIWSLFKRREVKRTHHIFYDAYGKVGQELTGPQKLGQAFLFGEDRSDLVVHQTSGPETVSLFTGPRNKLEEGAISEEEQRHHTHHYPTLTTREIAHRDCRYIFLCNSALSELAYKINGIPAEGIQVEDVFEGKALSLDGDGRLSRTLPPWTVHAIRISRAEREPATGALPVDVGPE